VRHYSLCLLSLVIIIIIIIIIIMGIQPLSQFGQEPEPSQATGMALIHCILGKFLGVVCHCFPRVLDFPTFAARCLYVLNEARDPSSERVELWTRNVRWFCLHGFSIHAIRVLLYAANIRHTSPPKDFFVLKIPTASSGFETANLDTKGQHATSRPPKPLIIGYTE
jgi:hypothetical protein